MSKYQSIGTNTLNSGGETHALLAGPTSFFGKLTLLHSTMGGYQDGISDHQDHKTIRAK
jgi:hypothetical protein